MEKRHTQSLLHKALETYKGMQRELPWRETVNPYAILVSECMLQQTQVKRVLPKYEAWMQQFDTVQKLANAEKREVLTLWSGLGYNRRGVALHEAAKKIVQEYEGKVPDTEEKLITLPGIGPYTAAAVRVFAYNKEAIMLETNIKTAVLFHHFQNTEKVHDKEIKEILQEVQAYGLQEGYDPRTIYTALMDYGFYLKSRGVQLNAKSVHYRPQAAFKGSLRQARGALLRLLLQTPEGISKATLKRKLPLERCSEALEALEKEGYIKKQATRYYLI